MLKTFGSYFAAFVFVIFSVSGVHSKLPKPTLNETLDTQMPAPMPRTPASRVPASTAPAPSRPDACTDLHAATCGPAQPEPTSIPSRPADGRPDELARATEIFPRVRKLLEEKLKAMLPGDPVMRGKIAKKISTIQFNGANCPPRGDGSLKPGGAYHAEDLPARNIKAHTFNYCPGDPAKPASDFQIVHIIAHELSHAIDPCGIAFEFGSEPAIFRYTEAVPTLEKAMTEYPFGKLLQCLRSDESVAAQRIPPYPQQPRSKDSPFCMGNDQMAEAFCDHMGTEIIPLYMERFRANLTRDEFRAGYANVFRNSFYCEPREKDAFFPHPDEPQTANNLLAMNPLVRHQMMCGPAPKKRQYCSMDATGPTGSSSSRADSREGNSPR